MRETKFMLYNESDDVVMGHNYDPFDEYSRSGYGSVLTFAAREHASNGYNYGGRG